MSVTAWKPEELEGYVQAWRHTWSDDKGGEGIRIFVKLNRALTEEDNRLMHRVDDMLHEGLERETVRLDPEVTKCAAATRRLILALFPHPIYVEEIPNGYCSRACCSRYPWFVVTTTLGRFKIGWRKSVIHLEWTETLIDVRAEDLFPDEDVTRGERYIHCWGYEKAAQYLAVLMSVPDALARRRERSL